MNFSSNIATKNDDKSCLLLFFTFHFKIYDTNLHSNQGLTPFFWYKMSFLHQTFTQKSCFRPSNLLPKKSEKLRNRIKQSQIKMAKFYELASHLRRSIPGSCLSPPLPVLHSSVPPPSGSVTTFHHRLLGALRPGHLSLSPLRPSASKRRGAPVWALRLPTPYGLRSVPG